MGKSFWIGAIFEDIGDEAHDDMQSLLSSILH